MDGYTFFSKDRTSDWLILCTKLWEFKWRAQNSRSL